MKATLSGSIGALLGFLITTVLGYVYFYQSLRSTQAIERVHLIRDLSREFYGKEEPLFRSVRTSIEARETLYKSRGGKFDHDQINIYLGFFEDLGYYCEIGALDYAIVNQQFGAYIIEAYEYTEVQLYVDDLRKNSGESKAFDDFYKLAKNLEEMQNNQELVTTWKLGCSRTRPVQGRPRSTQKQQ
ncbi:MAG: hypothetical protein ABSD31_08850 [Candidatus Binataceae bacterium]|jgi:hypothetical protein